MAFFRKSITTVTTPIVAAQTLLAISGSAEASNGDTAANILRFDQILKIEVENNNSVDSDSSKTIDEAELIALLKARGAPLIEKLKASMEDSGFDVELTDQTKLDQLYHDIAVRVLNRVDRNGVVPATGHPTPQAGVDVTEVEAFESAPLTFPFVGTVASILPARPTSPSTPSSTPKPPKPGFLAGATNKFAVRKSALDTKDIAKPASFTFTRYGDRDETVEGGASRRSLEVDGALIFTPCGGTCIWQRKNFTFGVEPFAAIDAEVSFALDESEDRITHRLGSSFVIAGANTNRLFTSQSLDVSFDALTDREHRVRSLGLTSQYTFNAPPLAIGVKQQVTDGVYFNWRPYIGVSYAEIRDGKADDPLVMLGDYIDLYGRFSAQLSIGERIFITPSVNLYRELRNTQDFHHMYELSGRYALDEKDTFSIEISHKKGEKAPTYEDIAVTKISLGFKY